MSEASLGSCPVCSEPVLVNAEACFNCGHEFRARAIKRGVVLAGRYEVRKLLGQGGMGSVYRAFDRTLDEEVAIKVLRPELARAEEASRRFRAEIKIARKVRHPGVCAIHEYGEDQGNRFIVMELLEGVDVRGLLRTQGAFELPRALALAAEIADALQALHAIGVIHRDLKSANVMLDGRGRVRLMDFGIAKQLEGEGMTATGQVVGTPEYMSPEQIRGHGLTFASDLYALGILLFELLTARLPFRGDTPLAVVVKQLQQAPPLDGPDAPSAPPRVVDLLRRLLAKDPAERPQNAGDVANELRECLRAMGGVAAPLPVPGLTSVALGDAAARTPPPATPPPLTPVVIPATPPPDSRALIQIAVPQPAWTATREELSMPEEARAVVEASSPQSEAEPVTLRVPATVPPPDLPPTARAVELPAVSAKSQPDEPVEASPTTESMVVSEITAQDEPPGKPDPPEARLSTASPRPAQALIPRLDPSETETSPARSNDQAPALVGGRPGSDRARGTVLVFGAAAVVAIALAGLQWFRQQTVGPAVVISPPTSVAPVIDPRSATPPPARSAPDELEEATAPPPATVATKPTPKPKPEVTSPPPPTTLPARVAPLATAMPATSPTPAVSTPTATPAAAALSTTALLVPAPAPVTQVASEAARAAPTPPPPPMKNPLTPAAAGAGLADERSTRSEGVGPEKQRLDGPPDIDHEPLDCFVENEFPRLNAHFSGSVLKARIYFRSSLYPEWYYVEMQPQGAGAFSGVLPRPMKAASPIPYYVLATSPEFGESRTPERQVVVVAKSTDCGRVAAIGAPPPDGVMVFWASTGTLVGFGRSPPKPSFEDLSSKDAEKRLRAAIVASTMGWGVTSRLATLTCRDSDSRVRDAALKSLRSLGEPGITVLGAVLRDEKQKVPVRVDAARTLGLLRANGASTRLALSEFAASPDPELAKAASQALEEIGPPDVH